MIATSGQARPGFPPPPWRITDTHPNLGGGIMITQERLKELLHYDPETGALTWALPSGRRVKPGHKAGTKGPSGYLTIQVDNHAFMLHRLVWFYVTGEWPKGDIDHINGIRSDNRFFNLRDVSHSHNCQNRKIADKVNKSGYLGVSIHREKYAAHISVDGKTKYLGVFDDPAIAHQAYLEAKRKHHLGNLL